MGREKAGTRLDLVPAFRPFMVLAFGLVAVGVGQRGSSRGLHRPVLGGLLFTPVDNDLVDGEGDQHDQGQQDPLPERP